MNKVRWMIPAMLCLTSSVLAGPFYTGQAGFLKGGASQRFTPCGKGSGLPCVSKFDGGIRPCGGCHLIIHTIALRGTDPPLTVWLNQAAWSALPLDGQITVKDGFLYVGKASYPIEYHNAAGERVDFSGSIIIRRSPTLPAATYKIERR